MESCRINQFFCPHFFKTYMCVFVCGHARVHMYVRAHPKASEVLWLGTFFGEDVFLSCEHQRLSCVSYWIVWMGWTGGLSLSSGQCLVPPAQSWHLNWYHLIKGKTRAKQAEGGSFAHTRGCRSSILTWAKKAQPWYQWRTFPGIIRLAPIRICIHTIVSKGFCYVDLFLTSYLLHKGLGGGLQRCLWW